MVHIEKRGVAVRLRSQGATYTSIKERLGVSKSTLSYWLRDVRLTPGQIEKIKKTTIERRVESYINTTRARREKIFQKCIDEERHSILPLTKRDLFIAGLFLYLGEGGKADWWHCNLSNSDPDVIRFGIKWFTEILGFPRGKIRVHLQLYSDMDAKKEIAFWKKATGLPQEQFWNPYIKKSTSQKINHRTFGHGTCQITANDTKVKKRILAGIKVIMDTALTGV